VSGSPVLMASWRLHASSRTRAPSAALAGAASSARAAGGRCHLRRRVDWPLLKLTVVGYDLCRAQQVEEYAEEKITERTSARRALTLHWHRQHPGQRHLLAVSFA